MFSLRKIVFILLILLFGVLGFLYYPRHQAELRKNERLSVLLSGYGEAFSLNLRTKSENCISENGLPDHDCTPGAVFENVSLDKICETGYSKTVRKVPLKLRKNIFAEYGVSYPQPHGSYEVDHLIPLSLGGNNDIANLFLEMAEPVPGFREKDIIEIYLHEEVCAGRVPLKVAQARIADNWIEIYNNLSPAQIEQIKSKFRNWSQ